MDIRRIVTAAAAAAVTLSAVTFSVSAEDGAAGYVYFMAEKTTIGQGFVVMPEKVPFYEGDSGIDIVRRAADVITEDTGYGDYITAFADEDLETNIPDPIAEVCPEMTGRNTEGYLSALDYTAESGWTYFINDEYATVGISDYTPEDGDVLCFSFTVYGYGADLGVDNSSWGGAAALKEAPQRSELIKLCAEAKDSDAVEGYAYVSAMESLAIYESTQEEIDNSVAVLSKALGAEDTSEAATEEATAENAATQEAASDDKGSPSTGVEGAAVAFAVALLAGAGIVLSKKN